MCRSIFTDPNMKQWLMTQAAQQAVSSNQLAGTKVASPLTLTYFLVKLFKQKPLVFDSLPDLSLSFLTPFSGTML
jgi:hypothetical protein